MGERFSQNPSWITHKEDEVQQAAMVAGTIRAKA